jgi:hypothetical protein
MPGLRGIFLRVKEKIRRLLGVRQVFLTRKARKNHCKDGVPASEYGFLIPLLPPGVAIVMDNASFHRKNALWRVAEKYGVIVLFLPP